ncbi:hypothetical protein DLE01_37595 [Streptomyces sp. FT05W]|nr:hypothetical protein [Streptomyces sp. FT05W]PWS45680.1 hypothetical protein DLE01_37595 [Streptomyces sp. FT05W]
MSLSPRGHEDRQRAGSDLGDETPARGHGVAVQLTLLRRLEADLGAAEGEVLDGAMGAGVVGFPWGPRG